MKRLGAYIKNYYNVMKLKEKMRFLVIILIACYLVVFGLTEVVVVSGNTSRYLNETSKSAAKIIGENITNIFQNVSNMTKLIMGNGEVISYLKGGSASQSQVVQEIYGITGAFDNIYSVLVLSDDNRYVAAGRDIVKMDRKRFLDGAWKTQVDEREGGYIVFLDGADIFQEYSGEGMLTFMRRIYDLDTQEPIGYLAVNMPSRILEKSIDSETGVKSGGFLDCQGRSWEQGDISAALEFAEELGMEGKGVEQITKRHLTHMEVLTTVMCAKGSLRLVLKEDITFMSFLTGQLNAILILLFFTSLCSFIVLGIFINRTITGPIARLSESMKTVKTGWLHRVSMELPNDEIGQLKNTYNQMLVETNNLIQELVEKEKTARQAELEVLQEQIKPHFLYNTLDTICYMTLENSPEEVYDALETLGKFYRRFLSKGRDSIYLAEEVEIVKDYLKLQKLRYGDLFEDVYEIPQELEQFYVPKLILQPLVENSIYHGIRPKGEKCLIRIAARRTEEFVSLLVYDGGVGMEAEEISQLLHGKDSRSFGFQGTIERIRYFYQREDVCAIRSEKGRYCEIELKLPVRAAERVSEENLIGRE